MIPKLFKDPKSPEQIYVDPAGFMDTKGTVQETLNAYSYVNMFQEGAQTKLIIVMEYSTLQSGRGGNVSDVAKRLFNLFPRDFNRLINSMMILITKVPLSEDLNEEDIYFLV